MTTSGARVLKSCDMLPHLNILIMLCLYQCFSSLIVHKSLLGILFKCRFLIKWGLRFQLLKSLDDVDAVNSDSLPGVAVSRPFVGHTNVTQANGLAISLLDFAYVDESKCQMAIISEHSACTLFGFVSYRSHITFFIQLSLVARSGQTLWGQRCILGATVLLTWGAMDLRKVPLQQESSKISAVAP